MVDYSEMAEPVKHSSVRCLCDNCKKARALATARYTERNRERIRAKLKTSNLTPEQRETRNKKRMEKYYREKALKGGNADVKDNKTNDIESLIDT